MRRLILLIVCLSLIRTGNTFVKDALAQVKTETDDTNMTAYNVDNYRDPFMPQIQKEEPRPEEPAVPGGTPEEVPEFNVKGMVWDTDRPQAIIDERVFQVGDEVKGAKIIDVTRDGVKLLYKGRIITAKPKMFFEKSK